MFIEIKRGMHFPALRLFEMMVVKAVDSFLLQSFNDGSVIERPARFVPNGIAVEVTD